MSPDTNNKQGKISFSYTKIPVLEYDELLFARIGTFLVGINTLGQFAYGLLRTLNFLVLKLINWYLGLSQARKWNSQFEYPGNNIK